MNVVILRSEKRKTEKEVQERYLQEFDTRYAERVLGNLRGGEDFCTACGPDCIFCRSRPHVRNYHQDIAKVIDFPAVLPYVLEEPASFAPKNVPGHDVLLAICIHEQILLEALKACGNWGTKGVVVPLEAPDWVSNATRSIAHRICKAKGIEISFPKPFCSFKPPKGSVLAKFREHFHIGYPDVDLRARNGQIVNACVKVCAACGATYCVARWLAGRNVQDNLEIEVVSKRWHAYPCTASMERDPELDDETPLHIAGQAHYSMLSQLKKQVAGLKSRLMMSPLGKIVQRPVPPQENLNNIKRAKQHILDELENHSPLTFASLRNQQRVNPAAINSALLILKKTGKIRTDGQSIFKA